MINLDERKILIRAQAPFSDLTDDEMTLFAKEFSEKTFVKGSSIVIEGAQVDSIYLIADGAAEVRHLMRENNQLKTVSVAQLESPQAIGLSDKGIYSDTDKRTATVVAKNDVTTLYLSFAKFHQFLKTNPHINDRIKRYVKNYLGI